MPSARGVKAGEAYVSIFGEDSALVRSLSGLSAKFKDLGGTVTSIGAKTAAAGAGITAMGAAIVGPLAAATTQFAAFGDTLDKTSARTGVTVEALGELAFAAEQSGASLADVEKGFFGLSRSLFDASRGSKEASDALTEIGLTYTQLAGLTPEKQFEMVADALSRIEDESKRGAVAQKLFGRSGRQLLPMLGNLRELRAEARGLGLVLTKTATNDAAKLTDAFNRIKRTIGGAFIQLGAGLAPPLIKALEVITNITAGFNKWVARNKEIVQAVAAIGLGLVAVGSVVTALGASIATIGFAITGIGTALGGLSAVLTTVAAPAVLIVAAIGVHLAAVAAGFAYVANQAGLLGPAFEFLRNSFGRVFQTFQKMFGGMVQALRGGQFQLAAEIGWNGVKLAFLQGAQQSLKGIEYLWDNAGELSAKFFNALVKTIYNVFKRVPAIALSALRGGRGLTVALQGAIAAAFSSELNLSATLDKPIAAAQAKLQASLSQVRRPGPAVSQVQRQGGGRSLNNQIPTGPRFTPGFTDRRIGRTVAATARAATGAGGGDSPAVGELVGLTRRQVFLLSRIAADGGLG